MKLKQTLFSVTLGAMMMASMPQVVGAQTTIDTQRQYLSGHGCDDMVNWDFYCTGGRNAGKWTKIGVPSCWELQGFGTYQYGMRFYGKPTPEGIADEKGLYKYEFTLPEAWEGKQIELVFEAVMTDAKVTINGRKAGSGKHQGGFYRFSFDVSDRIFFGKHKNRIEVEVSKESANSQVNMAERRADYWNFGGIFRPVFIVAKPAYNIARVAIDAKADGHFLADCYLNHAVTGGKVKTEIVDSKGKVVASGVADARNSDEAHVDITAKNPQLWTAETPRLYTAVFTLQDANGKTLHRERQKFGFRTIEYRASDGVYINGQKVIFKGVNRHSFRPETGRTLSKEKNIEDVKLIKSMNMNAVRLSHYPADPEFLEACDSLGLYVECELSGWHYAHPTIVGKQLVKEMITRDENHPSIIFWSNGNEGGFNYELEPDFALWDKQKRVVLYPWANRNGFETKHYRSYGETQEYMRQKEIFMPTEFLHGLYDGGHGAGLKDYWDMMMANPRCAGGFLWDLCDQGVKRTDKDGMLDCVGNFGADGIVGPHFEKEGSYYTIKEVWCPVQLTWNNIGKGELTLANKYDFINLKDCRFSYRLLQMPEMGSSAVKVLKQGNITAPDVAPGKEAQVTVPMTTDADAVEIKAVNHDGEEIMTWSARVKSEEGRVKSEELRVKSEELRVKNPTASSAEYSEQDAAAVVKVAGKTYRFDKKNGRLTGVEVAGKTISLSNGPRFVAARRSDRSLDQFYNHDDKEAEKKKTLYTEFADQGEFAGFEWKDGELTAKYSHGSLDDVKWMFLQDGSVQVTCDYNFGGVVDLMGMAFDYPEEKVKSKAWVGNGPYRVWQNREQGPQYGYWHNDYNDPIPGESWDYPEFKGYFANVKWMQVNTTEGTIGFDDLAQDVHMGVFTPRDGRDELLYTLPKTGLAVMKVIPAVRNKVNTTDLNGPSAQPKWLSGKGTVSFVLNIDK